MGHILQAKAGPTVATAVFKSVKLKFATVQDQRTEEGRDRRPHPEELRSFGDQYPDPGDLQRREARGTCMCWWTSWSH